jgi:hypothetical protein
LWLNTAVCRQNDRHAGQLPDFAIETDNNLRDLDFLASLTFGLFLPIFFVRRDAENGNRDGRAPRRGATR